MFLLNIAVFIINVSVVYIITSLTIHLSSLSIIKIPCPPFVSGFSSLMLFTGARAGQPINHKKSTNSKPQPFNQPIISPRTKSSPNQHFVLWISFSKTVE